MTKAEVKQLQQELNEQGANLKVDGILGSKTAEALHQMATYGSASPLARPYNNTTLPFPGMTIGDVMAVQTVLGVEVDGKWGKKSQAAWDEAWASYLSQAEYGDMNMVAKASISFPDYDSNGGIIV